MIQWISVCMLVVLHCVVLLQQCICAVYKQLLPSFAAKANRPRGIRPAAPKCIALALNESVQETQQLGLVLQWSVMVDGCWHSVLLCVTVEHRFSHGVAGAAKSVYSTRSYTPEKVSGLTGYS